MDSTASLGHGGHQVLVELGVVQRIDGDHGSDQGHLLLGQASAGEVVGQAGQLADGHLGEAGHQLAGVDKLAAGEEEGSDLWSVPGQESDQHDLDRACGQGPLLVLVREVGPARQTPDKPGRVAGPGPDHRRGHRSEVSRGRPVSGHTVADVLRVLPGQVHRGDGGHRLLVAPEHLLLEGDVGGQLDLLLDGGRLHTDHDAPVVSAEFAVDTTLPSDIALTSGSTHQSRYVTVNYASSEETLKYFYECVQIFSSTLVPPTLQPSQTGAP